MRDIADLLKMAKGDVAKEAIELNIEEFKKALSEVDSQMKNLPATAQVSRWFCDSPVYELWLSKKYLLIIYFHVPGFRLQLSKALILLIASTVWKRLKKILKVLSGSGKKVAIDSVPLGTS